MALQPSLVENLVKSWQLMRSYKEANAKLEINEKVKKLSCS